MDSKEAERLHLARELHDGPIQDLIGAAFRMQDIRMTFPTESSESLAGIQDLVTDVSRTLRAICGELRPQVLAPFGLEKAIRSHVETLQVEHPHITFDLDLARDGRELPENVRFALFRIFQQALTNVLRHAQASFVWIRLSLDEKEILLEVKDDGKGFSVPDRWIQFVREGHLGMAGIAERAEAIGGKMAVESNPGEGTCVQVRVPR